MGDECSNRKLQVFTKICRVYCYFLLIVCSLYSQVLSQGSSPLAFLQEHIENYVKCVKQPDKEGCSTILKPPGRAKPKSEQKATMQLYFEANRHYAWRTSCMTISLYCLILHLLQRRERTRIFATATTMTMKCHVKTNINNLFNCGYFVTILVCSHFQSDWYGRKIVKEFIEISFVAVLC